MKKTAGETPALQQPAFSSVLQEPRIGYFAGNEPQ